MKLKLKEVFALIDSAIVLEIAGEKEMYDSTKEIPSNRMNYIVTSIKPDEFRIVISLEEPPRTKSLEELGYSFEAGM